LKEAIKELGRRRFRTEIVNVLQVHQDLKCQGYDECSGEPGCVVHRRPIGKVCKSDVQHDARHDQKVLQNHGTEFVECEISEEKTPHLAASSLRGSMIVGSVIM